MGVLLGSEKLVARVRRLLDDRQEDAALPELKKLRPRPALIRRRLFGGWGSDLIDGGRGNDQLFGSSGNDYLVGQARDDKLFGGSGVDGLKDGPGRDHLDGGAMRDTSSSDGDLAVRASVVETS